MTYEDLTPDERETLETSCAITLLTRPKRSPTLTRRAGHASWGRSALELVHAMSRFLKLILHLNPLARPRSLIVCGNRP